MKSGYNCDWPTPAEILESNLERLCWRVDNITREKNTKSVLTGASFHQWDLKTRVPRLQNPGLAAGDLPSAMQGTRTFS